MTADECHERAAQCAINAGLAESEAVALEFLKLAAQWRAMASRTILLGSLEFHDDAALLSAPGLRLA